MKRQQGFTLIELIVVIVILGILAATAMPKFADLQRDARFASAQGALGAMQSASNMAHATWLVAGSSAATTVTMEGTSIAMTNGYPDTAGIQAAANLTNNQGYAIAGGGAYPAALTVTPTGAPTTCRVSFVASSATSAAPTITLNATSATDC